jgi:transposase
VWPTHSAFAPKLTEEAMRYYAGLDVSLKTTHVCIVEADGKIVWRGVCASDPACIHAALSKFLADLERCVLETGSTSPWLTSGLRDLGVRAVCVDARHARPIMKTQRNKTDRNDARLLADLARTGMFREVYVKPRSAQELRSALAARQQLVEAATALKNTIRGLLKPFGLVPGKGSGTVFVRLVREKLAGEAGLTLVIEPLLAAMAAVRKELARATKALLTFARSNPNCRRFMTMPGVGALVAVAFLATVCEAGRFSKSRDVGAHLGLTPRRNQSGEVDIRGRISHCGDALMRAYLYEAAGVMLFRWRGVCALKDWAARMIPTKGVKKVRVALARKMAVVLHEMWEHDQVFDPKGKAFDPKGRDAQPLARAA